MTVPGCFLPLLSVALNRYPFSVSAKDDDLSVKARELKRQIRKKHAAQPVPE